MRLTRDWVSVATIVLAVFFGWQIVKEAVSQRLPPEMALRIATNSSTLSRAAESEFVAKRLDNAEYLARRSLAKAPFNARALRVVGLAESAKGQTAKADDLITLAGNWSLRDDPAHAWLFHHRLTRGEYISAFAHADTLARRREDMWPSMFELFNLAATEDPRAMSVLVSLLASRPPWRQAFLNGLIGVPTPRNLGLLATVSASLEKTDGKLSAGELLQVYEVLVRTRQNDLLIAVRRQTARPPLSWLIVNGEFAPPTHPAPFEWALGSSVGIVPEILPDPARPDQSALRVEHNGSASGTVVSQLLLLEPGEYRLAGEVRAETGTDANHFRWTVTCDETGRAVEVSRPATPVGTNWRPFSLTFDVPVQGCRTQRLTLETTPANQQGTVVGWFDRFSIRKVG